jgi:hypothetical protein
MFDRLAQRWQADVKHLVVIAMTAKRLYFRAAVLAYQAGAIALFVALAHAARVEANDLTLVVSKDKALCDHMRSVLIRHVPSSEWNDAEPGTDQPVEFAAVKWRTVKGKYFTRSHGNEQMKSYSAMRVAEVDADNDGTTETVVKVAWRNYDNFFESVYIAPQQSLDLNRETDAEELRRVSKAVVRTQSYALTALPGRITEKELAKFGAPMTTQKVGERLVEGTDVSWFDLLVYGGRTYWTFSSNVTLDTHEVEGIRRWHVVARMRKLDGDGKSSKNRFEDVCYFVSK